jgi:hypothetical protein
MGLAWSRNRILTVNTSEVPWHVNLHFSYRNTCILLFMLVTTEVAHRRHLDIGYHPEAPLHLSLQRRSHRI